MTTGRDLLHEFVTNIYRGCKVREKYDLSFARGSTVDLFVPSLKLAFDYDRDDWNKRMLCRDHGITVVVVNPSDLEFRKLCVKIENCTKKRTPWLGKQQLATLKQINRQAREYRRLGW